MNSALIRKFRQKGTIPDGPKLWLDYANSPMLANGETLTRATTATYTDQDSIIRTALAGQARMQGQRVVRNLSTRPTQAFTTWLNSVGVVTVIDNNGTAPDGSATASLWSCANIDYPGKIANGFASVAGNIYVLSFYIRQLSGTPINCRIDSNDASIPSASIVTTSSWQRVTLKYTASTTGAVIAGFYAAYATGVTGTWNVWGAHLEDVTGQSNQNPGEYQSVGVLAPPYQGLGIDGAKAYSWLNGNTVAANVVTEAQGAAINGANAGFLIEPAATQILALADVRDMTTANWTLGATATRARTSIGADGVANKATRITFGAVAATNTITTTITAAATSRTYSALVKRITGTGPIRITQDGFATNTDISSLINTSTYSVVPLTQTQLNAVMGFKGDTSGDAIDVDFNQFESGTAATSRIPDSITTRSADVPSLPSAGIYSVLSPYTIYARTASVANQGAAQNIAGSNVSNMGYLALQTNVPNVALFNDSGTLSATKATGSLSASTKYAARKGPANQDVYINGVIGTTAAIGTPVSEITTISLGNHNGGQQLNGVLQELRIWRTALTDSQIAGL